MASSVSIFYSKRLFLFPTFLSILMLTATFLFPNFMTTHAIILFYWVGGTSLLFILTRLLRVSLRKQDQINSELKQQKNYLENLIESAPEAIIWGDYKQRIKYVNKKFVEMFGYSRRDVIGKNIDILLSAHDQVDAARAVTEAVREGKTQQFEGIRLRKDGKPIHVSIVGAPVHGEDGKVEVFGLYRDTTEEWHRDQQLIKSEKELRDLSDQLSDANNFKELLLDIITHDLRNPASVISGAVELLKMGQTDGEVLELIDGSANNLHEIIESASTLSKLSVGEDIGLEPIDVIPLIKKVAQNFDSQLKSAEMTLEYDLPETMVVNTNPILSEVISNYLSNGIKYASQGKRLLLKATWFEGHSEISLADFGTTIPEDKRESIFQRKVQLLESPRKGSGVGLAIVKRISEANDATAGVRPNSPGGNIFYFRFNHHPED